MPSFDWKWWDSLEPEERSSHAKERAWDATSRGFKKIKKRIKDNEGEFFDWER